VGFVSSASVSLQPLPLQVSGLALGSVTKPGSFCSQRHQLARTRRLGGFFEAVDMGNVGVIQRCEHPRFEISGQKFFLPLQALLNVTFQVGNQTRNEMEFGNYRKFSEATLKFQP
jgi:hypothetical protein